MRHDLERSAVVVAQHDRGGVRAEDVAQRAHDLALDALEVEASQELDARAM